MHERVGLLANMSHIRNPTQRTFFEVDQLLALLPRDDPYCGRFLFFPQTILPQLEQYRHELGKKGKAKIIVCKKWGKI
jgi:hypothetical protein